MLSVSGCDGTAKLVGIRWIPAFAGMTNCYETVLVFLRKKSIRMN